MSMLRRLFFSAAATTFSTSSPVAWPKRAVMLLKWAMARIRTEGGWGQVDFALQGLVHGDAVAGIGQRVAQGALQGRAIEQGVAQGEQQAGEQGFQLAQFLVAEALVTAEGQFAQVFALVAQAVGGRVVGALAELQAQVAGGQLV